MASSFVRVTGTSSVSGLGRDHDPRRMHTRAAHQAFEPHRRVDQRLHRRLIFIRMGQRAVVREHLGNRHADLAHDHLRNPIHLAIRHIERAPYVFDRRLRGHRVERNDLRDLIVAILLPHILDHLAPAIHAEIDIDIGHGHTFGIEKSFEQQLILQRIDVRNLHAIRNQRPPPPSRAPAPPESTARVHSG